MRRKAINYSAAEMRWLEENRMMVISDYHRAFLGAFGRDDVSAANLHWLRKRKGWKIGPTVGRTKGRRLRYSPQEINWLRDNCTMVISEYHRAFCAAFKRTDVSLEKLNGLRKREGWKTGRDGHFNKGSAPANKGKKCALGRGGRHPNARKTQFRKGQLPHNARGAGHESIGDDGYVWIVTDRRNPWTGASTWRVHKHRWLWEQLHGPIREGMCLKCKGDVLNTDPSNWECVPRGLLPRLNNRWGRGYDDAPDELKPSIMAVAKLEHEVRQHHKRRADG